MVTVGKGSDGMVADGWGGIGKGADMKCLWRHRGGGGDKREGEERVGGKGRELGGVVAHSRA